MKLIEIVQGKWLGHPLHPALVHLPIGAWLAACVLDLVMFSGWPHDGPARLAFYCTAAGLVGAALAVPPGLAEWISIKRGKPAKKLGVYHMLLTASAALLWTANLILRLKTSAPISPAILATSVAGTLLLLVGAYVGSLIVFDQGIGVARYSKKEWRQRAIRGGARVPEES